jgi:hypothetical protein
MNKIKLNEKKEENWLMKHKRKQKNIVLSAGISAQEEKAERSGLKSWRVRTQEDAGLCTSSARSEQESW